MWKLGIRKKSRTTDSCTLLMENNNNDMEDGNDQAGNGYDNASAQNTVNCLKDQHLQSVDKIKLQELAELLGAAPDANNSEDGSCCSMHPETNSGQQNLEQYVVHLIQRSVFQHFPNTPADLDQNLQQHLFNVQETVCEELVKLGPLLDRMGLMGCLIDCYHRQTFDHLNELLQKICSSQNFLLLMKFVLKTYLSEELLNHPDLQKMDPIKTVDFLLLTKWVENAKGNLLKNVQRDVSGFLEKILQSERRQEGCNHEEACIGLYVDTVQCIDALPKEAQKISLELSGHVRQVCFQELLTFLERYTTEQTEILEKKVKLDKPETIHFFKSLNTCKKLKQHVQTQSKGIKTSLLQDTVKTLENMEAFTSKLLMEIVADIAERHLKSYFKRENKQFFSLITEVKTCFPKLSWCQDVQKSVMDEAYKLIAHIYLKYLVRSSQSKLTKHWSRNVGQSVTADAELLHSTISHLAPGVQQWNLMLLEIQELLECQSTVAVVLTVASMQKECLTWSKDRELLPALLRWKGLSRWQIRTMLKSPPWELPRPASVSWYSFLICW